jgi:DNA repair ATPase RecN
VQNKEPDLTKFQDIGSKLSKTVSDEYIVIIEEIVQIIEIRWKKLKSRVEIVAKDLFTGKEEMEKFKTNMDNVEDWLAATETKLSNLEAPSFKPDKVKKQIKELTVSGLFTFSSLVLAVKVSSLSHVRRVLLV